MSIATQVHGDILVARVEDTRIDAAAAIAFKDDMIALRDTAQTRLILDLAEVEFLDSSGLGALVAVMKSFGSATSLELAGLNPIVAKVLRLTRMDQVFTIHTSAAEALSPTDQRDNQGTQWQHAP